MGDIKEPTLNLEKSLQRDPSRNNKYGTQYPENLKLLDLKEMTLVAFYKWSYL